MKIKVETVLKDLQGESLHVSVGPQEVMTALVEAGMSIPAAESTVNGLAPFFEEKKAKKKDMTWKHTVVSALGGQDKDASAGKILDRIGLALKIQAAEGEIEISNEQRDDILLRIKATYVSPIIYYRVNEVLAQATPDSAAAA